MFLVFRKLPIFISLLKENTQGTVFSTDYIFAYEPDSAVNSDKKENLTNKKISITCCWGKIIIHSWSKNIIITDLWSKKSLYPKHVLLNENFTTQTYLDQSAPFHPKPKKKKIFCSAIWKLKAAAFQNTLEFHHDQLLG